MADQGKLDFVPVHEALSHFGSSGSLTADDIAALRLHQRQRSQLRVRQKIDENLKRIAIFSRFGSKELSAMRPRRHMPKPPRRHMPKPLSCDSGWNGVWRLDGGGYDFGSAEGYANQAEFDRLPTINYPGGVTANGATRVALADPVQGLISIGAGVGEFCDLIYPPTETSGAWEATTVSASLTKIIIVDNLHALAPNALSVAVSFSESDFYAGLQGIPGDPTSQGGGRVSNWGLASVDVTLGIPGHNLATTVVPPEDTGTWAASASDYLWFMTELPGPPFPGGGFEPVRFIPINTAGPDGGLIVKPTIAAPWKVATLIMVDVTIELFCTRTTGSSSFSYIDCSTGLVTPPIFDIGDLSGNSYWISSSAPIAVDSIQICGI